jgi:hypothetical protein
MDAVDAVDENEQKGKELEREKGGTQDANDRCHKLEIHNSKAVNNVMVRRCTAAWISFSSLALSYSYIADLN